jgi:hypothetical protein
MQTIFTHPTFDSHGWRGVTRRQNRLLVAGLGSVIFSDRFVAWATMSCCFNQSLNASAVFMKYCQNPAGQLSAETKQ